ncbi:MAG TPA: IS1182 family transposase [Candidatus Saccharimonadales bacterium]|nr:IS1182 family transposase [Candidatus Saccharimonadales bacterium]
MMGLEEPTQNKLFYTDFHLESRVRQNHPLRKIAKVIDFSFAYAAVSECYGKKGNVSVPPPLILKLMLLLVFYNVRSERELMSTLPERLDWLWFLGYDLDTSIPDHSVLSKARARWGSEVFQLFFERIVFQCVEAGLVDGKKIFIDSSLIDANASKNSVIDKQSLKTQISKRYKELELRLDEIQEKEKDRPHRVMNNRYVSTTDPEAGIFGKGKSTLCYKTHRAVEERSEVITAVEVTAGDIDEGQRLESMLKAHEHNTEIKANTVVADSKYGTIENYIYCDENTINGHMVDLKTKSAKKKEKNAKHKIFPDTAFKYDPETDTYICPGNKRLKRKSLHAARSSSDYAASKKDCSSCELKSQCTKNKVGRTVKRHFQQDVVNEMREKASSANAKADIRKRQHLMERSFANAKRYGFDRARWRGLTRVSIQEFLICCVQNINALIKKKPQPRHAASIALKPPASYEISLYETNIMTEIKYSLEKIFRFLVNIFNIHVLMYV